MKSELNFLTSKLIAHRGMHSKKYNVPENSISAFKRAIRYHLPIELDIHILKDDSVVVFHDSNLKRMTGVDKYLRDCTYNDIKELKLKGTNNHIPLFSEVLELVNGKVPLLIETKCDAKYGVLEECFLDIIKDYKGEYAVQSFNPFSIRFIHKKKPSIKIGLLSSFIRDEKDTRKERIKKKMIKPFLHYDFISSNVLDLDSKFIKKNKKSKVILGWTIEDKHEIDEYNSLCDNFICNNLDEILKTINH